MRWRGESADEHGHGPDVYGGIGAGGWYPSLPVLDELLGDQFPDSSEMFLGLGNFTNRLYCSIEEQASITAKSIPSLPLKLRLKHLLRPRQEKSLRNQGLQIRSLALHKLNRFLIASHPGVNRTVTLSVNSSAEEEDHS
ncbi:hypothetical protein BDW66DRAFT_33613 [Aspergillus desertorum]